MTQFKNNKGFTLVEVIISIAVLSVVCAIVLRLFVVADEISKKSKNEDIAVIYAINAIEKCKASESIKAILESFNQDGAKITENNNAIKIEYFFDDNWDKLPTNKINSKNLYILDFTMTRGINQLYDINSRVFKLDAKLNDKVLITEFKTQKYFQGGAYDKK